MTRPAYLSALMTGRLAHLRRDDLRPLVAYLREYDLKVRELGRRPNDVLPAPGEAQALHLVMQRLHRIATDVKPSPQATQGFMKQVALARRKYLAEQRKHASHKARANTVAASIAGASVFAAVASAAGATPFLPTVEVPIPHWLEDLAAHEASKDDGLPASLVDPKLTSEDARFDRPVLVPETTPVKEAMQAIASPSEFASADVGLRAVAQMDVDAAEAGKQHTPLVQDDESASDGAGKAPVVVPAKDASSVSSAPSEPIGQSPGRGPKDGHESNAGGASQDAGHAQEQPDQANAAGVSAQPSRDTHSVGPPADINSSNSPRQ